MRPCRAACATSSLSPVPASRRQKLTETANNIGDMRSYFANQDIMFNLDLWNSFTDEQKALMDEAAKATSDWSVAQNEELEAALKADVTGATGRHLEHLHR